MQCQELWENSCFFFRRPQMVVWAVAWRWYQVRCLRLYRQDCGRGSLLLEVSGNCLFLAWVRRVAVNSAQPGMNDRRIRCLIFRGRKSGSSVTSIKRHFEPSPADGPVRLSERLSFGNPTILLDFNLHFGPCKPWQTFLAKSETNDIIASPVWYCASAICEAFPATWLSCKELERSGFLNLKDSQNLEDLTG